MTAKAQLNLGTVPQENDRCERGFGGGCAKSEDVYLAAPELTQVWQAARRDDVDCGVQVDCSEGFGKGDVVDQDGHPVEGACVIVGKDQVFTDSQGHFSIQEKRKDVKIMIDVEDFMSGTWDFVEQSEPGKQVRIVVKKK